MPGPITPESLYSMKEIKVPEERCESTTTLVVHTPRCHCRSIQMAALP